MKFLGVASWRGWNVTFSDGMCANCAARAREEWQLPPAKPRPAPPRTIRPILRPDFAFAAAVVVLVLAATVGVVVGPPNPSLETAAPRVDVAATPAPDRRVDAGAAGLSSRRGERSPSRSADVTRPGGGAAPSSGENAVAVAPDDDAVVTTPSASVGGRASVRRVADGPRVRAAAARPGRPVSAMLARPALATYPTVLHTAPVDVARAPEPVRVVGPTPLAWRLYADATTYQAP